MRSRFLSLTIVCLLAIVVASVATQCAKPTQTPASAAGTQPAATATLSPTITAAIAVEIRSTESAPQSFWDKYGVITAIVGAVVALIFGVLLRPAAESLVQMLVQKFRDWRSEFESRYLRMLVEEHRVLGIRGVKTKGPARPELEQVYVSLKALPRGADLTKAEQIDITNALCRHRRMAIIGEAGSGKTTLLSYLALTFARRLHYERLGFKEELLPVLVPLRNIVRVLTGGESESIGLANYLEEYYQRLDLAPPEDFFEKRLRDGKCLVLFDGLDEVADEVERLRVAEWVDQQVAVYPDNRYILTSRIAGYEKAELANDFSVLEVQAFLEEDVRRFCENWCLAVQTEVQGQDNETVRRKARVDAQDLIAAIEGNSAIQKLAVNPLLLSIIALVHHYRAALPSRRVELYSECMDVLLGYWDKAKGLPSYLTPHQKRAVLQPIALAMHKAQQRFIDYDSLKAWMEVQLPKVGGESRMAEQFLQDIKERSGVLLESETNQYAFSHLSFQEYLTAMELLKTGKESELVAYADETWWHEIIRLYAGLKDATSIIESLIASGSPPLLILAGNCLIDAEQVDESTRGKAVRRLEECFASCTEELFLRVGEVLANISGEDSVDFFLRTAVEDGRRGKACIQALVQMAQQSDESLRRRVQQQLIAAAKANISVDGGRTAGQDSYQRKAIEALHWVRDPSIIEFLRLEMCPEEMVTVPVGIFTMGDGAEAHQIVLPTFFIDRHPATNADFAAFVNSDGYRNREYWTTMGWQEKEKNGWTQPAYWEDKEEIKPAQPVVGVSWYEAVAFCNWRAARTGLPYRLPTEAEWEKASRGTDGHQYPWGDEWDELRCNTREGGPGRVTEVGAYSPIGDSPYGIADMAGNVWEWCNSAYGEYPYEDHDGREDLEADAARTVRGGSYAFHSNVARCSFRDKEPSIVRLEDTGFRCCLGF